MQEPVSVKALILTLSMDSMEGKAVFKQPKPSKKHAFPGGKPIIHKSSLHPNLTGSKKEMTRQNNIVLFCFVSLLIT